jgi:hypothetical protein
MQDSNPLVGKVKWELRGPDGELKATGETDNIITETGDNMYGTRGATLDAGIAAVIDGPSGMKLGTGAVTGGNLPAKNGTGAALTTYLTNSHQAFDGGFPTSILDTGVRRIRYVCTFAAGKADSVGVPITEAIITNEATLTNATNTAANTVSRVALSNIGGKGPADTLTITWDHRIGTAA